MSGQSLTVSVIINTLGRASLLADALLGLAAQTWSNLEVIVVNGPSQDDTQALLAQWVHRIRIGHCAQANLSMSRNIGLGLSSGEIVAFMDDDAIPHPRWIETLVACYDDPRMGAAGGFTIGRLGTSYQARTTLCDRFGTPYSVSDHLDLKAFCKPGSWAFPSLLGTNSSFRRDALFAIGGFDETFTYYLEETDVCLRLIDAGWQVAYAPDALVWHQFASSALRSGDMTRRSIRAIMRSQSYFMHRHGLHPWSPQRAQEVADALSRLFENWRQGNRAALASGAIDASHAALLDRELEEGLREGFEHALRRGAEQGGHWRDAASGDFLPFAVPDKAPMTIAFVCRQYLAAKESGIPRWTHLLAHALASEGHRIHIFCEASDGQARVRFAKGIWVHEIPSDHGDYGWVCERYGLPPDQAQWAASVRAQVEIAGSFGFNLLSFPIWDLEGVACLDLPWLSVCMSLHTTYAITEKFREDWAVRPLLRESLVDRMKKAESRVLTMMDMVLANSASVVAEVEGLTGCILAEKAEYAVHGVPLPPEPDKAATKHDIIFAGRFEQRKGIDMALEAFALAARSDRGLTALFVGGDDWRRILPDGWHDEIKGLVDAGRLHFGGVVDRLTLDAAFADARIALLPSRYESFGLVAAEALSFGCPVLALDCGGIAEVVTQDVDGILVAPEKDAARHLADAILALRGDPDRLQRMQIAARRTAQERFGVARMAMQVETAYRRFLVRKGDQDGR